MPPTKRKLSDVAKNSKESTDKKENEVESSDDLEEPQDYWLSEIKDNDTDKSDENESGSDFESSDEEDDKPVFADSDSETEKLTTAFNNKALINKKKSVESINKKGKGKKLGGTDVNNEISKKKNNKSLSNVENNQKGKGKQLDIVKAKNEINKKKGKGKGKSVSKEVITDGGSGGDSTNKNLKKDEYEEDTSDEEDIRNTVGNIPMNWYDDYAHLGYDWDGKKILKPLQGDQLDEFLKRMEDPDFWRTVKDNQTGQNVVLSDADVELIERMQSGKIPDKDFDEYAPWVDWFTSVKMKTPVRNFPEHKRSFLPSKTEKDKIAKLVHALKMGWIKTEEEKEKERQKKKEPKFYMLWRSDDSAEHMRRIHDHIPAPKRLLPGHAESYNPPPEYLFDKKEEKEWRKQTKLQLKRKLHFLPQKYNSLREVPAYDKFIYERFQRCLDLYLCPRGRRMRLTIEPEDLVPQLPNPKDLQPFPTVMSIVYKGHTDMIRTLTIDAKGQYLVSGSDDMTIKVWEVSTGRCLKTIPCGGIVRSISWCPSQAISLILVAADRKVLLINPGVGDSLVSSKTDTLLEEPPETDAIVPDRIRTAVQWEAVSPTSEEWLKGIRVIINHFKEVTQVSWHGRGDYFSTVMPDGANRSVIIHQLSKRRSQIPFNKSKGLVQCVVFHPIKPFLFVATQKNIRIYDLVKQELVKKLLSNSKWISTMAIHPGGDNVLVGTYDRKMLWFDLDLSTEPYQTLRLHSYAVRGVAFHKRYPLFASGSDDRNLIICHGMVYNDLLQNPLIVPLKRLCHHEAYNDFGIFSVIFHPTQPWVFTSGADATIRLYI